jgi:hypothetical protein
MIWVVDKKVIRHLVTSGRILAEVPLRVTFEYAVESGTVVVGSLSIKVLYNCRSVQKSFPEIVEDEFNEAVEKTASDAILEHLALSGLNAAGSTADSVVIAAH